MKNLHKILSSTDQQQQETLIEKYMQLPNAVWDDIINQVGQYSLLFKPTGQLNIAGEQKRGRVERPRGGETAGEHSQDQRARLQGARPPLCLAAGQVCVWETF